MRIKITCKDEAGFPVEKNICLLGLNNEAFTLITDFVNGIYS